MVTTAVQNKGKALRFANYDLLSDKQVVLAALRKDGEALSFAADDLKADKEVVLQAVQSNTMSLRFADPKFRNDKDVVLATARRTVTEGWDLALAWATPTILEDEEVKQARKKRRGMSCHG